MQYVSASLTLDGPPEQVAGQAVTPDFFTVLGVQPALGRVFTEDEDRSGARVVAIGYALWQRRYQGDPAIIGRTIPLNGATFTVTGVHAPRVRVRRIRRIIRFREFHAGATRES